MLTILALLHYILLRFGCVENVGKCPQLVLLKVLKMSQYSVAQKKKISQQLQQRRRSEQLISRRQSMEEKVICLEI